MREGELVLAAGLTDEKRHVAVVHELEIAQKLCLEGLEGGGEFLGPVGGDGGVAAAEPLLARGELGKPGVRGRDDEDAAGGHQVRARLGEDDRNR